MKPYILRTEKAVEPQTARRARVPQPTPPPAAPAPAGPALCIGLDVHNDSIAVSLAPSDGTEVRRYGIIGGTLEDVLRLSKKLAAAHPGRVLKFCYEAGPRGYPLCRFLRAHGTDCIIVSPSKVPRAPGDRVKTDRRDADQLARLFRAGELTGIYVPDAQDEAIRDLIRARYQVQRQRHRARQQLKMFLLRQNIHYTGTAAWGAAHLRFLATVKLPFAEQQWVFQEMVNVISEADERLARYEKQIAAVVATWRWEPVVKALMSLRGVALLTGATLVAELGDLERFPTAPQLMSYLGLCPSARRGLDPRRFARSAVGAGPACRDHQDGQWDCAQSADRGGVELPEPGADRRDDPGAAGRVAQGGHGSGVERADAVAPKIQTSDRPGAEESDGGGGGAGAGTGGVRVGHWPDGEAPAAPHRGH
jgi:transposase